MDALCAAGQNENRQKRCLLREEHTVFQSFYLYKADKSLRYCDGGERGKEELHVYLL